MNNDKEYTIYDYFHQKLVDNLGIEETTASGENQEEQQQEEYTLYDFFHDRLINGLGIEK